jgi:hypothetical protein
MKRNLKDEQSTNEDYSAQKSLPIEMYPDDYPLAADSTGGGDPDWLESQFLENDSHC